jgi:hypothetical protein
VPAGGGVVEGGADVGGGGGTDVGGGGTEVGGGVGVTTPVQVTPLRVKAVGTGLLPVHEPLKPGVTVAPAPSEPLYEAFVTVTALPVWAKTPFQPESTCWPAAKDHCSVHELNGSPRLVTATLAPNPTSHWVVTV